MKFYSIRTANDRKRVEQVQQRQRGRMLGEFFMAWQIASLESNTKRMSTQTAIKCDRVRLLKKAMKAFDSYKNRR